MLQKGANIHLNLNLLTRKLQYTYSLSVDYQIDWYQVKGPLCSFEEGIQTQNTNITNINEVILLT